MKIKIAAFILLIGLLLILPQPSQAQSPYAVLSAGSGSGLPGATNVNITVSLSSFDGAEVSAVNFDLNYDSSRLLATGVTTGAAASSAEKSASGNLISPGTYRVIVLGNNQYIIPNGVIANLSFDVLPGAAPGTTSLSFSNSAASSPEAEPVPLNSSNGSFTVLAPPATNTPPNTATFTPTSTNTATTAASATASATSSGASPTPSHTPQPSDTPSAGATNTSAPANTATLAPSSTDTPTTETTEPVATSDPSGTASSSPQASEALTATPQEKSLAMDLASSIAATGTAYASLEGAVAATATSLALSAQAQTGSLNQAAESQGWLQGQTGLVLFGGLGVGLLIAASLIYRVWKRRSKSGDEDTESTQPSLG
jgi:hypothetical protein